MRLECLWGKRGNELERRVLRDLDSGAGQDQMSEGLLNSVGDVFLIFRFGVRLFFRFVIIPIS